MNCSGEDSNEGSTTRNEGSIGGGPSGNNAPGGGGPNKLRSWFDTVVGINTNVFTKIMD